MTFPITGELAPKGMVMILLRKALFFHQAFENSSKLTGVLSPPFLQLNVSMELLGKMRASHVRSDFEFLEQILEIARLD